MRTSDIIRRLKTRGIDNPPEKKLREFYKLYDKYVLEIKLDKDSEAFNKAFEQVFGDLRDDLEEIANILEEIDRIPDKILIKIETLENITGKRIEKNEINNIRRNIKRAM